MKILLILSCQDLYSYDEKYITVGTREITKEGEIEKLKNSRNAYLGIHSSWEKGILVSIKSGEPVGVEIVWDKKVDLKVKLLLNEKALELRKEKTKKAFTENVANNVWMNDFLQAVALDGNLPQVPPQVIPAQMGVQGAPAEAPVNPANAIQPV